VTDLPASLGPIAASEGLSDASPRVAILSPVVSDSLYTPE
jgi:hypothetical protein